MNTTAAATQANVTVATIRHWCRTNVIAAVKQAGRWIIDATSLARRIEIGRTKTRMTTTARYHIVEGTSRWGSTIYTVKRTDGIENDFRIYQATYVNRADAELHCEFVNRTPDQYHIRRDHYRSRSMRSGAYWEVTGSLTGDPKSLRQQLDADHKIVGNWPSGTRIVDMLVTWAVGHAEGAAERIAKKAEQDAIEAAEAAVREGRVAQLAELRQQKGELATPRQVDYILQLLGRRERAGEGGGFFYGPTDRAGIEEMSRADASTYITSLKGDY